MTPNEYTILRMFADRDRTTVRQVAGHMRNADEYAKYLCGRMVNAGLPAERMDASEEKPVRAYRLTPESQDILADLCRGMEMNLRRRTGRFQRVAAIVEERAEAAMESIRCELC